MNELNVNKPQRVWDLNKYNPNFDPNQIKIGDKVIVGSFTNIVMNTLNSALHLDGNGFVSFEKLLGFNNRNRKLNESEQITVQSILDFWNTKMQSRPKVNWDKFNQIKTKYFGKDKYVGLMDLEDNLDNNPLQPEQLTNLYSDLQKLFKLNELNVNNPKITPELVWKYYRTYIQESAMDSNLWQEYLEISNAYCDEYNIYSFIGYLNEFKQLSYSDLIKIYKEMQDLVEKHTINELEINKPPINLIPGKNI